MQTNPDRESATEKIQETVTEALASVRETVEKVQEEVTSSREARYRVFWKIRLLASMYIALFVLFGVLAWFVHYNPVIPIDVAVTREFQENNAVWLRNFMIAVSFLGYQPVLFGTIIVLTALAFWVVQLRLEAILIVGLSIVSEICNELIKFLVNRPRPTAPLVKVIQAAGGKSFPSGHVMSYVAFFALLFSLGWILFKRDRWWHYLLLVIPMMFVVLVGPSRIYLGDHWASDVLGGYMLGGLLLGLTLWLYLALKKRGVLTEPSRSGALLVRSAKRSRRAR